MIHLLVTSVCEIIREITVELLEKKGPRAPIQLIELNLSIERLTTL